MPGGCKGEAQVNQLPLYPWQHTQGGYTLENWCAFKCLISAVGGDLYRTYVGMDEWSFLDDITNSDDFQ